MMGVIHHVNDNIDNFVNLHIIFMLVHSASSSDLEIDVDGC